MRCPFRPPEYAQIIFQEKFASPLSQMIHMRYLIKYMKKRTKRLMSLMQSFIETGIIDKNTVSGTDREILRSAAASLNPREHLIHLLGDADDSERLMIEKLNDLPLSNMNVIEIGKQIGVRTSVAIKLLAESKRLSKGHHKLAEKEASALLTALWISPFVKFALLDIDESLLTQNKDLTRLDASSIVASIERNPLVAFAGSLTDAIDSVKIPCSENISINALIRSDIYHFTRFLHTVLPIESSSLGDANSPKTLRISILELQLPVGFVQGRERELESYVSARIRALTGSVHVVLTPRDFSEVLIALMSNVDRSCAAGYFSSLRPIVIPALSLREIVKHQLVVKFAARADNTHFGTVARCQLRTENDLSLYPKNLSDHNTIFPVPREEGVRVFECPTDQLTELDASSAYDSLFDAISSTALATAIEQANIEIKLQEGLKFEGEITLPLNWHLDPHDCCNRLQQLGDDKRLQRECACGYSLISFSSEFILNSVPEAFEKMLSKWQIEIFENLQSVSNLDSRFEGCFVSTKRGKIFSLRKAKEFLITHLNLIRTSYLTALNIEVFRLNEMVCRGVENLSINDIPADSALRMFWPSGPLINHVELHNELLEYCECEAYEKALEERQNLSLDAPIQGMEGEGFRWYDLIAAPGSDRREITDRFEELASMHPEKISSPENRKMVMELLQMIEAKGHDTSHFLALFQK